LAVPSEKREKKMKNVSWATLGALLASASVAYSQTAVIDTRADYQKTIQEYVDAYNKRDIPALVQMYRETARRSTPSGTATGRQAIEQALTREIETTGLTITAVSVDRSQRAGPLNWAEGTVTGTVKQNDTPISGHWVIVSEYFGNRYLILSLISNREPPASPSK